MADSQKVPVIIGAGETIDRESTKEPKTLLLEAVRRAAEVSPTLLPKVDSLDVISIISWRYADIAQVVAQEIGAKPTRAAEGKPGGETPILLLAQAAERIAAGTSKVALICGAEAIRTRARAAQAKHDLDWGPTDTDAKPITALDFVTPLAARYGLVHPTHVYPLYENAARHRWRQSKREADIENSMLWSRYAAAAAGNPHAWLAVPYTADAILADDPNNRLIAYPYRKLMVANPLVNQGAAVLLTSLDVARSAGVPEDRITYVWSGASANEAKDFLSRDRFDISTAQDAVLTATMTAANGEGVQLFELYSCFPIVPKMARRHLGLGEDVRLSVTGGLTFFGGPANNYMTHAVAAATRALHSGQGHLALLYGQGEFVTKHAAVILADHPPKDTPRMRDVQKEADALAARPPLLLEDFEGSATLETFTIGYDRDGMPDFAAIVARTPAGERVVAGVLREDESVLSVLIDPAKDPIGLNGCIERSAAGKLRFSLV